MSASNSISGKLPRPCVELHRIRLGLRPCLSRKVHAASLDIASCNRWKRWCNKGLFRRMLHALASQGGKTRVLLTDSTRITACRLASSLGLHLGRTGRKIGGTTDGLNCELHIVTDAAGRPILIRPTAATASDCAGAKAVFADLPGAREFMADRACDADWFRVALTDGCIDPCIPPGRRGTEDIPCDRELYKCRNEVEGCVGLTKDWRRVLSAAIDARMSFSLPACGPQSSGIGVVEYRL